MPDDIATDDPLEPGTPKDKAIASLKREIEQRLRPYCEDWPPEQFDTMINSAAEIEWRHLHRHERWSDHPSP